MSTNGDMRKVNRVEEKLIKKIFHFKISKRIFFSHSPVVVVGTEGNSTHSS